MKNMIAIACFTIAPFAMTFSSMSPTASTSIKDIEAITIQMQGDILIANSDNPEDPLTTLQVVSRVYGLVAQTDCSGQQCTLDLSSLSPGIYLAKAWTVSSYKQQWVTIG